MCWRVRFSFGNEEVYEGGDGLFRTHAWAATAPIYAYLTASLAAESRGGRPVLSGHGARIHWRSPWARTFRIPFIMFARTPQAHSSSHEISARTALIRQAAGFAERELDSLRLRSARTRRLSGGVEAALGTGAGSPKTREWSHRRNMQHEPIAMSESCAEGETQSMRCLTLSGREIAKAVLGEALAA